MDKKQSFPRIPYFASGNNEIIQRFYQPLLVYYAAQSSTNEDWIRVIWNLVENISVDRSSFKQAIKLIDGLAKGKDSILSFLSILDLADCSYSYQNANSQLQEEIDSSTNIKSK